MPTMRFRRSVVYQAHCLLDSGSFVCVSDIKNIYTCRGLRDWKWSRVKVRLNQYAHGIYNVIIIFIIIAVTTANKTTITTTTTTGAEQLKSVEDKNWPKERKRESEKKKILKKKKKKKKRSNIKEGDEPIYLYQTRTAAFAERLLVGARLFY